MPKTNKNIQGCKKSKIVVIICVASKCTNDKIEPLLLYIYKLKLRQRANGEGVTTFTQTPPNQQLSACPALTSDYCLRAIGASAIESVSRAWTRANLLSLFSGLYFTLRSIFNWIHLSTPWVYRHKIFGGCRTVCWPQKGPPDFLDRR